MHTCVLPLHFDVSLLIFTCNFEILNDLSFIFSTLIKILNIYVVFKKRFKRILKNKRSPGAWENLELWLQLQGKHGSGALQLQLRVPDNKGAKRGYFETTKYIYIVEGSRQMAVNLTPIWPKTSIERRVWASIKKFRFMKSSRSEISRIWDI